MNETRLITYFDRVSEAPDAIPHLRRFILDLAVRGKLVEQDPDDEPATELMGRIQAEKTIFALTGRTKTNTEFVKIPDGSLPFSIPHGWCWVRLIDLLTKLTDGTHHSPPNVPEGDFKYVTAKNIKPEGISLADISYVTADVHRQIYSRCNPEKGDILYIKDGATTGIVTINDLDEPFSMLSSVALLKLPSVLCNRLVAEFLRSPFFYDQMRGFMKGAAITRVTLRRMAPALIPLPPLAEQRRIVGKVDELMALCDRLEIGHREQEKRRSAFAAASLYRLTNTATRENAEIHASFYLNHLPQLTLRSRQIVHLREAILDLAFSGRLADQDPADGLGSDLIERISKDLGAACTGRRECKEVKLPDSSELINCPDSWTQVSLETLTTKISDGEHFRPKVVAEGVPFLSAKDVREHGVVFDHTLFVSEEDAKAFRQRCDPESGDILVVSRGATVGRSCIVETERVFCLLGSVILLKLTPFVAKRFILWHLKSPEALRRLIALSGSTAQQAIYLRDIKSLPIPLPPLAEQHRIVTKLDEMMKVCDRLEEKLTTANRERDRLLEAVLHQALHGRSSVTGPSPLQAAEAEKGIPS